MNATKIVSANYRDRRSLDRWLVRDMGQDPDQAVVAQTLYATGVAFCPSSDWETGFGCRVVAFCETAVANGKMPEAVASSTFPIKFAGHEFYNPATGETVLTCDHLILNADGSMMAAVNNVAVTEESQVVEQHA